MAGGAKDLYYPAMPARSRPATLLHPVTDIYGDEFREGPHYKTLRTHGSGDYLLILTLGGSGRITFKGDLWETRPGDVLLYEPSAYQDYGTSQQTRKWHLLWAHFAPGAGREAWLDWPRIAPGIRLLRFPPGKARSSFAAALRRAGVLSHRKGAWFAELAANALNEALIHAARQAADGEAPRDPRIHRVLEAIAGNVAEWKSVDSMARLAGLSTSRFAHLFRSSLGMTPLAFLEAERLHRAAGLLRFTKLPVGEIAQRCGYDSAFYFSRRFRKRYHASPVAFRRTAHPS